MGILDSKSRIMDVILTSEGRRQMAEGTFRVSFATFSDREVGYKADDTDGHIDPVGKIYLEACNLPQDQIIFEANDDGNIISFRDDRITFDKLDSIPLLPKPLEIFFSQGKATAYQLNFGPRVQVRKPGIDPAITGSVLGKFVSDGMGVGFSVIDSFGSKANFILDPSKFVGTVSSSYKSATITSSSYYIGVKGGLNARDLTTLVQATILSASIVQPTYPGGRSPGPHVEPVDRDNNIYITDLSGSHDKVVISLLTGSGNYVINTDTEIHPFVIEDAFLGGRKDVVELPNADFASQIQGILTSSFDNFSELGMISTIDPIFLEESFQIFPEEISFDINQLTNKQLIEQKPTLNSVDSLFSDDKLSNTLNFKYLPPIVKTSDAVLTNKTDSTLTTQYQLANFKPLGSNLKPLSYSQLIDEIKQSGGFAIQRKINFEKTTRSNNLLCQLFEVSKGSVQKLDIIDHGFIQQEPGSILQKRVYFVGKVFLDDRGTACFLNIFTLIFSQDAGEED